MPKTADINEKVAEMLKDLRVPAPDRGDMLIYELAENGIDCRPAVHALIQEADTGRVLKERLQSIEEHALTCERFLGVQHVGDQCYAIVTNGPSEIRVPAQRAEVDRLGFGDAVWYDAKTERIVGLDGVVPPSGVLVKVDAKPSDVPDHVVVRHHDETELARVHHLLMDDPRICQPETRVLYDPIRRFVLKVVDATSDGQELLVDLEKMGEVRRSDVGAPRPIVDEIVSRFRMFIEHPDWIVQMRARNSCSYLFSGGTGNGKSFHLQLIVTEIHDVVEKHTGQRVCCVVMLDASQFWDPLFGVTEQKITAWVEKIKKLGSRILVDRDGNPIKAPLIIVLEEAEALLRSRSERDASSHLFDRPLSLLLQKTSSLENALQVPVIWLATSNRCDLADAAALRRVGMRQVPFGALYAAEAKSVLEKKLPEDLPIVGSRSAAVNRILAYLYGPEPKQGLVEVRLASSQKRIVNRSDSVTPAVLEEAVSAAVDRCLDKSDRAGKLLGLDPDDVVAFLHRHFFNLSRTIRAHNIAEHCADLFSDGGLNVVDVAPIMTRQRRPTQTISETTSAA